MKFLAVRFGTEGFGQLSQILALGALFSVLAGGGLTKASCATWLRPAARERAARIGRAAIAAGSPASAPSPS